MNIPTAQELKRLQTYAMKLRIEIDNLTKERNAWDDRIGHLRGKLQSVRDKIQSMEESNPTLTEHAMLRYLERTKGISLEEVHKEIMTDNVVEIIKKIRNGKVPLPKGAERW